MLEIERSAHADVPAPPSRCLEILAAVEDYPSWSSLLGDAAVLERAPDGSPRLVRLGASVFGLPVEMQCSMEVTAGGAALHRIPDDADDEERYEATWSVRPAGEGATVELQVSAALDAPGAAKLLGGRIAKALVDDLVADFARAAS